MQKCQNFDHNLIQTRFFFHKAVKNHNENFPR